MLRLCFRTVILTAVCMCLLIALSNWLGQMLPGDVFLYLTQLHDEEHNTLIYAFDTRTSTTLIVFKQPDVLDFTVAPNRQRLLYTKRENRAISFYLLDIYSGESRLLLSGEIDSPRWSPDGRWIAFRQNQIHERGLFVMPGTGGSPRRITEQLYGIFSWSPDSQNLVYAMQLERKWGIYSASIAGGQAELQYIFEGTAESMLAVVSSIPQQYDFTSGEYETSSGRMVFSEYPIRSPEGERIAFVSVSLDLHDLGLSVYSAEGEFQAIYQPEGLSISSPLIWWLSG